MPFIHNKIAIQIPQSFRSSVQICRVKSMINYFLNFLALSNKVSEEGAKYQQKHDTIERKDQQKQVISLFRARNRETFAFIIWLFPLI